MSQLTLSPPGPPACRYRDLPQSFKSQRPDLAGAEVEFKAGGWVKAAEDGRTVTSKIATYGTVDQGADVIMPGAAAKTIAEDFAAGRVKHFLNHSTVLGPAKSLTEAADGLYLDGLVSEDASLDLFLTQIKDGTYGDASLGYRAERVEFVSAKELKSKYGIEAGGHPRVRVIHEMKVYEGGPVLWGMHPESGVVGVKGGHPMQGAEEKGSQEMEKKDLWGFSIVIDALDTIHRYRDADWAQMTEEEAADAQELLDRMTMTGEKMATSLAKVQTKSLPSHVQSLALTLVDLSEEKCAAVMKALKEPVPEVKSVATGVDTKSLLAAMAANVEAIRTATA